MLESCFLNLESNLDVAERVFSLFYKEAFSNDFTSSEFVYFFPSKNSCIYLERDGNLFPSIYRKDESTIALKTPKPSGYRAIRDRIFPKESAILLVKRMLNYPKFTREVLIDSMKPFLKKEYRFSLEDRKDGLFELNSNRKILTFSSWNIENKVEMLSLCLYPEVTEIMKNNYGENNYIGLKDLLKEIPLYFFYQAFFQNILMSFFRKL